MSWSLIASSFELRCDRFGHVCQVGRHLVERRDRLVTDPARRAQVGQRPRRDRAGAVRRTVEGVVVHQHELVVGGQPEVELEHVGPPVRVAERLQGVLGETRAHGPSMSQDRRRRPEGRLRPARHLSCDRVPGAEVHPAGRRQVPAPLETSDRDDGRLPVAAVDGGGRQQGEAVQPALEQPDLLAVAAAVQVDGGGVRRRRRDCHRHQGEAGEGEREGARPGVGGHGGGLRRQNVPKVYERSRFRGWVPSVRPGAYDGSGTVRHRSVRGPTPRHGARRRMAGWLREP